ncbi:MAG: phosphatidylserine decarboxylase [Petrotogales bacterium]
MKIAQGSVSWIIAPFMVAIIFMILAMAFIGSSRIVFLFMSILSFVITMFFLLFFRDPNRDIGKGIVSPADGKIREISRVEDDVIGDATKISIFMNVYNVHVNRMPLDGVVKDIVYTLGSHTPAFKKESESNERLVLIIDTHIGRMKLIQIAGTLARRIVPYVNKGDTLKKGKKIGIIRFGSRVDVYLPAKKIKSIVKVKDNIKAGEDTIAEIYD